MKKKLVVALSLVLAVALAITGTVAYLTGEDEVTNVFMLDDNVDITLDEAPVIREGDEYKETTGTRVDANTYTDVYPGAVMPKDPTVHLSDADTTADAYVRAKVTVTNGAVWLPKLDTDLEKAFDVLTNNTKGAGWTLVKAEEVEGDVVYTLIYETRLDAGDSTTPVFEEIVFPASFTKNDIQTYFADKKFNVDVIAESIQAAGFDSARDAFAETVDSADALAEALANAGEGDVIALAAGDYGTVTIDDTLTGVTIKANKADVYFNITADAVLEEVTFKNMKGDGEAHAIDIAAGAAVKNVTITDSTFADNAAAPFGAIYNANSNAELTITDCVFENCKYAVYGSTPMAKLTIEDCEFKNVSSWVVLLNGGDTVGAKLTINNNKFTDCVGGIAKYLGSSQPEGATTVFTNNTLVNCKGHDGSDAKWFTIPGATATVTVSGNTLDGAAWTPGTAQGLGK